uniref:Uncharacterized protein n=1 Tax=Siphoviridae sp. ctpnN3 TaxID=2825677 RepID=A0A8S5QEA3_9CAUD|nr:MAG TPA: hypothetical protein [Siphoviridae sp. ctpnN3]
MRVRPASKSRVRRTWRFNPRTREGATSWFDDTALRLPVSIHAPVRVRPVISASIPGKA